jgi:putative transposase
MRTALPTMTEHADTLKPRGPREHDGRKRPRRQMRSLLASGQAYTRREVARLLGVHHQTSGHWLALDASGGLDTLLALYGPAGKPSSLPSAVLAALERVLRQPTGFASSVELRQWITQTQHLDVNDHTLSAIVRPRLKAKLNVPRPSPTKTLRRPAGGAGDVSGAAAARHSSNESPAGVACMDRGGLDAPVGPRTPQGGPRSQSLVLLWAVAYGPRPRPAPLCPGASSQPRHDRLARVARAADGRRTHAGAGVDLGQCVLAPQPRGAHLDPCAQPACEAGGWCAPPHLPPAREKSVVESHWTAWDARQARHCRADPATDRGGDHQSCL